MKNKWLYSLFLFATMGWMASCRSPQIFPISKMCVEEGAHSGDTVKLTCTGIGHNHTSALIDAKKAASFHVVKENLKTPQARMNFANVAREFYLRYNTFVKDATTNGSISLDDDGRTQVKALVEVDQNQVMTFLKDFGVADMKKVRKAIGNPTVAVISRWVTKDTRWEAFIQASAATFLTSSQYNAVDIESGSQKLDQLGKQVLQANGIPGDKPSRTAMLLGADVLFEISASAPQNGPYVKGMASIKAYETTTKRLIGTATGFGASYSSNTTNQFQTVKEAIQNCMQKVLTHVSGYWQNDVKDGNRYYVLVAGKLNAVEDMNDIIAVRLKRTKGIKEFKRTTSTSSRMTMTFQSHLDQVEISLALKQNLRNAPGVSSLTVPMTTRKFFVILINHTKKSISDPGDSLPGDP